MSPSSKRTALITGGARGIGAAIAAELAQAGFAIIAPTREELDLENPVSLEAYVNKHADLPVDVLINNAGINVIQTITDLDPANWQAMVQINLSAPLRLIQAFTPRMQLQGWGRILNISSVFSLVTKEKRAAYSATKAGLNALTRTAAVEYGASGVLVNALCPGYVETALTYKNNSVADLETIKAAIPLGRLAKADELAKVAGFLCSEHNTYLTGQMIVVDGGFTCK